MDSTAIALDLSWAELDHYVGILAGHIREDGIPHTIVGILRGGMIPAVLLAHRLGVRDVRGIEVTRTLDDKSNSIKMSYPQVVNPASLGTLGTDRDVLLVDDVAGSGDTLSTATALLAGQAARVHCVVIVVNTINWNGHDSAAARHVPEYIGTTCAGWVRFPWEG